MKKSNNKEKICTGCNNKGIIENSLNVPWVKEIGRKNDPPERYLPSVKNLIPVDIEMGKKYASKYIYYFATESCEMLLKSGKKCSNLAPSDAYDNYENSGVAQLDSNGYCRIIISKPVTYSVKEENYKTYNPHIHFKLSTVDNKWSKYIYTKKV